jgi:hypothetical protein
MTSIYSVTIKQTGVETDTNRPVYTVDTLCEGKVCQTLSWFSIARARSYAEGVSRDYLDAPITDETRGQDEQAAADLMTAIFEAGEDGIYTNIFSYVRALDADGLLTFLAEAQAAQAAAQTQGDAMWWHQQVAEAMRLYDAEATTAILMTPELARDTQRGIEAVKIVEGYADPLGWAVDQWLKSLTRDSETDLQAVSMTLKLAPFHYSRINRLSTLGNVLSYLNL